MSNNQAARPVVQSRYRAESVDLQPGGATIVVTTPSENPFEMTKDIEVVTQESGGMAGPDQRQTSRGQRRQVSGMGRGKPPSVLPRVIGRAPVQRMVADAASSRVITSGFLPGMGALDARQRLARPQVARAKRPALSPQQQKVHQGKRWRRSFAPAPAGGTYRSPPDAFLPLGFLPGLGGEGADAANQAADMMLAQAGVGFLPGLGAADKPMLMMLPGTPGGPPATEPPKPSFDWGGLVKGVAESGTAVATGITGAQAAKYNARSAESMAKAEEARARAMAPSGGYIPSFGSGGSGIPTTALVIGGIAVVGLVLFLALKK
jgi:hypothetical protein